MVESEKKLCILPVGNSHTAWCVVDRVDWEWAKDFKWFANHGGYVIRNVKRDGRWRASYLHKEIAERMFGADAMKGVEADHIDRRVWNNSRSNLRRATRQENSRNRPKHKNNTSGVTGVFWDKRAQKWRAHITSKHLGLFVTKEAAIEARKRAERQKFGEFAPQLYE